MTTPARQLAKEMDDLCKLPEQAASIANMPPDEFKSIVATKLQIIVNDMANRLHNELHSIPLSKLPLAYGILQDKLLQLQGEQITKPQKTVTVSHTDFNKLLAQLPTQSISSTKPITIAENNPPSTLRRKKKGVEKG
tara:strand:+ start:175 stop:585 length:411 start_codon:yes stop_codon:yes gene_type:complete